MKKPIIGCHLLVDIFNVSPAILQECEQIHRAFYTALCRGGMHILGKERCHIFENQGSTLLYILQESHAALHTYPEHGFISLDIYSCSSMDPRKVVDLFLKNLNRTVRVHTRILERGGQSLAGGGEE